MTGEVFEPLMLQPEWVLERYFGWSVSHQEPGIKLLRRRRPPIEQVLLLSRNASSAMVESLAREHRIFGPFTALWWNDFSARTAEPRRLGRRMLEPVREGRWFGIGTFVIDLTKPAEELWRAIAPRERSKCRQATRLGVAVDVSTHPNEAQIQSFLRLQGRFARVRGLESAPAAVARRIFGDGNSILALCSDERGRPVVSNLVYAKHGQGYFLYGAKADGLHGGAGHLTQWEIIRSLKELGLRWYDLGLVASSSSTSGIYRFKKSLGGTLVEFGQEYRWAAPAIAHLHRWFQRLRKVARNVKAAG